MGLYTVDSLRLQVHGKYGKRLSEVACHHIINAAKADMKGRVRQFPKSYFITEKAQAKFIDQMTNQLITQMINELSGDALDASDGEWRKKASTLAKESNLIPFISTPRLNIQACGSGKGILSEYISDITCPFSEPIIFIKLK